VNPGAFFKVSLFVFRTRYHLLFFSLARTELNKGLALPSREKDDGGTKERGREALKKL